jgi:hypothetical protein
MDNTTDAELQTTMRWLAEKSQDGDGCRDWASLDTRLCAVESDDGWSLRINPPQTRAAKS